MSAFVMWICGILVLDAAIWQDWDVDLVFPSESALQKSLDSLAASWWQTRGFHDQRKSGTVFRLGCFLIMPLLAAPVVPVHGPDQDPLQRLGLSLGLVISIRPPTLQRGQHVRPRDEEADFGCALSRRVSPKPSRSLAAAAAHAPFHCTCRQPVACAGAVSPHTLSVPRSRHCLPRFGGAVTFGGRVCRRLICK